MAEHDTHAAKEQTSPEAPPAGPMILTLDPHVSPEAYAKVREKDRVARVSFSFGEDAGPAGTDSEFRQFLEREHLFITRYDDVIAALLDDRISSDSRTAMTPEQQKKLPQIPEELRPISKSLLTADPPDHSRLRKLIQPSFTPRAMEPLSRESSGSWRTCWTRPSSAAAERGEAAPERRMDLIAEFAYPLPVTVIRDMLGIPREDRERCGPGRRTARGHRGRREGGRGDAGPSCGSSPSTWRAVRGQAEAAGGRHDQPDGAVAGGRRQAEPGGDAVQVFILFFAGHVTTVNLIGNGVYALLSHPEQHAQA